MRATWIADTLRAFGLEVVEHAGWETRGADVLAPQVVVVHHTASRPPAVLPSLRVVLDGRADVPGPLCHVLIGRDCVCHVIAAGVTNNAGAGSWQGITGNRRTLGIEVENDGVGEPWTEALYGTTVRCAAALAHGAGLPADRVIGHKEWAPGRKIDPTFQMGPFRDGVAKVLVDGPAGPAPVATGEDTMEYRFPDGGVATIAPRVLVDRGDGVVWGVAADGAIYALGRADYAAVEASGFLPAWGGRVVGQAGPDTSPHGLRIVATSGEEYAIPFTAPNLGAADHARVIELENRFAVVRAAHDQMGRAIQ